MIKYRHQFFLITVSLITILSGCVTPPRLPDAIKPVELDPAVHNQMNFKPHDDYLSMEIPYGPIPDVEKQIEKIEAIELKNRGEAHITLLTPPEYAKIKNWLPMSKINELTQERIQKIKFDVLCVGEAQKGPLRTFYLVVKSPEFIELRQLIRSEVLKKMDKSKNLVWSVDEFHPHITIGFTERDLHLEDGVIKDELSCKYYL